MSLRELLLDPLVVKELHGTSRRWQTFAGRILYVALIGFVIWNFTRMWERQSAWLSISDYAGLGRELFEGFFGLQMGMVTLGAVSAASDMVTKETRAGTLGVLTCTPLSPFRIALGKWKAAMAQTSTLILCGAPILAVCVFLGGATAWDLAYSFSLTLAAAALGAALSLYLSTMFRSGVTVALVALALLGVYTLLPAMIVTGSRSPEAVILAHLHPVYAAIHSASPRRAAGIEYAWVAACAFTGLIAFLFLRAASRRVAVLAVRSPKPPVLSRAFDAMDRFYEQVGPEKIRNVRLFGGGDRVWESHALLWKELRTRASGKFRNSVRIAVALLILAACTFGFGVDFLHSLLWISALAFTLLALSNGVGLFVTEKEERKWDVLLSTPLSSWEIVRAKLLAGLVPLVPTTVLIVLFWICCGWLGRMDALEVLQMLAVVLLPGLLAYAVGAVASLHAASLRGAFTVAFAVMIALLGVLPFLLALSLSYGSGYGTGRFLLAVLSPAPYLDDMRSTLRHWGGYGYAGTVDLGSFPFYVAIYGGAIAALVAHLRAGFDRITGRVRG